MTLDIKALQMNGNHGRISELTCEVHSLTRRVNEWEKKLEQIKDELVRQGAELNDLLRSESQPST